MNQELSLPSQLIDSKELVARLRQQAQIKADPTTLVRWRRLGLPYYQPRPRIIRFSWDEVWIWLCASRNSCDLQTAARIEARLASHRISPN